jgi:hypothetical protein
MNNKSLKELAMDKRLENIERMLVEGLGMIREIHAVMVKGKSLEMQPGSYAINLAVKKMLDEHSITPRSRRKKINKEVEKYDGKRN